ncbi:MAG: sulfurtransferase [Saprospiraceae bacterium]|nr:sulfurtransferase [Saprospiraceae bacterium]
MAFTTLIQSKDLIEHLHDQNWVIVDCRFYLGNTAQGELEYLESHIPGSYYAHLDRDLSSPVVPGVTGRHPLPQIDDLIKLFSSWGIEAKTQVVAYDQAGGGIAARLWWLLRWLGHNHVAVLDGGWQGWISANGPVDKEVPSPKKGHFTADVKTEMIVDADTVDTIREDKNWTLVDSREERRYRGLEEPIDPVAGHIKGAINYPFMQNVHSDGIWKTPAEIALAMDKQGIHNDFDHTAFYCGSGVTACHNLLAYKYAGLGDAKLYPGSWSEWITAQDREIATEI